MHYVCECDGLSAGERWAPSAAWRRSVMTILYENQAKIDVSALKKCSDEHFECDVDEKSPNLRNFSMYLKDNFFLERKGPFGKINLCKNEQFFMWKNYEKWESQY